LAGDGYRGGYTQTDGTLTVRYNDIMQWTDFEDAVYRMTP